MEDVMFTLTITCILLATLTATFWVLEAKPAYKAAQNPPKWKTGIAALLNLFIAIGFTWAILKCSKFLIIDVSCTILIVAVFNLGGLIGTTMGFAISNVISIALAIARTKEKKAVIA